MGITNKGLGPTRDSRFWNWPNGTGMRWMADIEQLVEAGFPLGTGKIFYVDSGVTTEGNGTTWATAKQTIDAAIGLCTASRGDIILVAQGHAESVAGAAGCVLDIAGVTIIGIGNGALIPTITLGTATAATISVTAANCRISGIKIISDLADVAAGITAAAGADGLVVDNCILSDGGAAKELVIGISLAAGCDNCRIVNNTFYTADGGGCASAIKFVGGSDDTKIIGNMIFGDYSAAALDLATAASTRILVMDNLIRNADTTASFAIDCHASTTGWLARNYCGTEGGAHGDAIAAADMSCAENVASGADGAQGIAEPAVDT